MEINGQEELYIRIMENKQKMQLLKYMNIKDKEIILKHLKKENNKLEQFIERETFNETPD